MPAGPLKSQEDLERFLLENELRMPSTGASTIDSFGAELLHDWIAQMNACP